jgi:hypothetical protein
MNFSISLHVSPNTQWNYLVAIVLLVHSTMVKSLCGGLIGK